MIESSFPLCVVCASEVNFHQHALCCDKCFRWQHRLCNSGITYKDYRFLTQGYIELTWQCSACSTESIVTQSSKILIKDQCRRSKRGVKLRKDPNYLYKKETLTPSLYRSNSRVELTDLPSGWGKKPKRKSVGPNKKHGINYISPNGRIFQSKQLALEFCKLHYQEVTNENLELLVDTPSSIIDDSNMNKKDPKITPPEFIDKSLQPFIRLHKLNNNRDNIRIYQPFIQLQRLSPFNILRETKQMKPYVKLRRTSDTKNTDLAVKDTVIQRDNTNINIENIPVKDDNNNKMSKIKMKQTNTARIKRNITNIKRIKNKGGKSPMKVKAIMKKDYLKINLKIDRKSLQIHPNHNLWFDKDQNLSERRWNLKLGSVKIKDNGKFERNNILGNAASFNDSFENEINVENHLNQPKKIHPSHGSRLIWLHISPKDLEFGLIS